jgi:glycosyltransferase involved in cell wall biosynthesis
MDKKENLHAKDINLSFCIPTYNRARYLNCLLDVFYKLFDKFNFTFEIIISNNASTDETDLIVEKYIDLLPIKYFKQSSNIGGRNLKYAIKQASGELFMYLADDDLFDINGLNASVEKMLNNTNAVVLYAPWKLKSLISEHDDIFFYQTEDICIRKNDFANLARHIIDKNIWSEISIARTELTKFCDPLFGDLAYWAFTIPCEYLSFGDVLYSSKPFYISVTSYFEDETREQAGHVETEQAWDKYRGGLEFLLGRGIDVLSVDEVVHLRKKIDAIILDRMIVGLRLRIASKRNPYENYQLASRIRGLGGEQYLPIKMQQIRSAAIIHYLTSNIDLLDNINTIYMIGDFDLNIISEVKSLTELDVVSGVDFHNINSNTLVLIRGDGKGGLNFDPSIKIVTEKQLFEKFF